MKAERLDSVFVVAPIAAILIGALWAVDISAGDHPSRTAIHRVVRVASMVDFVGAAENNVDAGDLMGPLAGSSDGHCG